MQIFIAVRVSVVFQLESLTMSIGRPAGEVQTTLVGGVGGLFGALVSGAVVVASRTGIAGALRCPARQAR